MAAAIPTKTQPQVLSLLQTNAFCSRIDGNLSLVAAHAQVRLPQPKAAPPLLGSLAPHTNIAVIMGYPLNRSEVEQLPHTTHLYSPTGGRVGTRSATNGYAVGHAELESHLSLPWHVRVSHLFTAAAHVVATTRDLEAIVILTPSVTSDAMSHADLVLSAIRDGVENEALARFMAALSGHANIKCAALSIMTSSLHISPAVRVGDEGALMGQPAYDPDVKNSLTMKTDDMFRMMVKNMDLRLKSIGKNTLNRDGTPTLSRIQYHQCSGGYSHLSGLVGHRGFVPQTNRELSVMVDRFNLGNVLHMIPGDVTGTMASATRKETEFKVSCKSGAKYVDVHVAMLIEKSQVPNTINLRITDPVSATELKVTTVITLVSSPSDPIWHNGLDLAFFTQPIMAFNGLFSAQVAEQARLKQQDADPNAKSNENVAEIKHEQYAQLTEARRETIYRLDPARTPGVTEILTRLKRRRAVEEDEIKKRLTAEPEQEQQDDEEAKGSEPKKVRFATPTVPVLLASQSQRLVEEMVRIAGDLQEKSTGRFKKLIGTFKSVDAKGRNVTYGALASSSNSFPTAFRHHAAAEEALSMECQEEAAVCEDAVCDEIDVVKELGFGFPATTANEPTEK
jgi:hypothetical protein